MVKQIEILIPTARKRLSNILFQIRAALASPVNCVLTIAMSGPWPELIRQLSPKELDCIRFVENAPDGEKGDPQDTPGGYMGMPKILWCLENLSYTRDWLMIVCDDDALLPWGIEHLCAAADPSYGMVIGQVLCVSRKEHLDFSPYTVGRTIERCRVGMSNALFNVHAIKGLSRPWWNINSGYADWELIERLSKAMPYKIIPSVVQVLSICEINELPVPFKEKVRVHSMVEEAVPC